MAVGRLLARGRDPVRMNERCDCEDPFCEEEHMSAEPNQMNLPAVELPTVITPLEMLSQAVQRGVDADSLQKFMDLHDRWQREQAKNAYNRAVASFKANPPDVVKDMKNKQYNSMYTSLANLVNTVNRSLAAHDLTARWTHTQEAGMIGVTCILSHAAGHSESVTLHGPPDDSGAKNMLQKIKSTLTYLKAATFEAVTGIASREANEDDDGNSAADKPQPTKIGPKRMRKIVDGMLGALEKQDGPALLQIWDELESDEKLLVWNEYRSWERSGLKELLNKAKAADCGVGLVSWAIETLKSCKDLKGLNAAWGAIQKAYEENGVPEPPLDVDTVYQDLKKELK